MISLEQSTSNSEQIPYNVIHNNTSDLKPTSAEISHLWATYLAESESLAMLKHMVATSKEPEFHRVLQSALDFSTRNVELLEKLFNLIQHPIPEAFGEKDVNVNAPALFDDAFSVRYTRQMTNKVLINHSIAYSECIRSDFRELFSQFIDHSKDIIRQVDDVLLAKGIYAKPPYIQVPDKINYIDNKTYYGSIFGNDRPLNVLEISSITSILHFKVAMKAMFQGLAQVLSTKKLRDHLNRGQQMISGQIVEFCKLLESEGLPSTELLDDLVTDSRESPYSDRLMIVHTTTANTFILSSFGLGLSRILRKDIVLMYSKFMIQIMDFSKDCADLLIENKWVQEVPQTVNRKELTQ